MIKYLLVIVLLLMLGFSAYLLFNNKNPFDQPKILIDPYIINQQQPTSSPEQEASEAAASLSGSTSATLDDDLTALEKDLLELEQSQDDFSKEINSL